MSDFVWTGAEVVSALETGTCGYAGAIEGLAAPSGPLAGHRYTRVWTDSRTVEPGDLFVALVGERFDGHDFLHEVTAKGALAAVVTRDAEQSPAGLACFTVADTLRALGDLAAHRRRALSVPVVGLTGSSGKTTTKELLRAALATTRRVHATEANYNNRIGVPQTLLATPDDAEVVVLEMGTSEPGEIARLAEIGRPDLAILITVGEAHLDLLGSLEGVMQEKLDILRGRADGGISLVGDLPEHLPERAREVDPRVHVAGDSGRADPERRAESVEIGEDGHARFSWGGRPVRMGLAGRHAAYDAWIALAAAEELGVPAAEAIRGVESVGAPGMRGEIRRIGAVDVMLDCYNANPQSTRAAIDTVAGRAGHRVALLGSMLELGEAWAEYHREVLLHAAERLDAVWATGDYLRAVEADAGHVVPPNVSLHADPAEALPGILEALRRTATAKDPATLLLKASRGVGLETHVPALEAGLPETGPGEG